MTDLAITPKRLGQIQMATYCARCFWYLLRLKFHPPFDHFGGAIFKKMEQIQMAIVGILLDNDGRLPDEFAPFCNLSSRVDYPRHWSKFQYPHKSGVLLYGEPDDIFDVSDGSIAVVDHKTARYRGGDDPFLPCYATQVVGYANIAELGLKLGKVSKGGLFYWEIDDETVTSDPARFYRGKELWVPFAVKTHSIDINYSLLDPLLKEVKQLWKADTPPVGAEKCDDCKKLDLLLAIEDQIMIKDQKILQRFSDFPSVANPVISRMSDHRRAKYSAWSEFMGQEHGLAFADDGMFAAWNE
jgi:hypothetical protein